VTRIVCIAVLKDRLEGAAGHDAGKGRFEVSPARYDREKDGNTQAMRPIAGARSAAPDVTYPP
jgi:hypothetical protein